MRVSPPASPVDRLHTTDQLTAALAPLADDYAATLDATRTLPATDRARALQRRRGLYRRLLRNTLRTAALLKEGR